MSREINRHENAVLVFTVQQDDYNSPTPSIFYEERNKKSSKALNSKKKEFGEGEGEGKRSLERET